METTTTPPTSERHVDILLVDNSSNLRRTMQLWLETRGYSTITARSAAEAEQLAAATPPRVVITDLGLPGCSGYDLLKTLRNMEALRRTCFIAFSGDSAGRKKAQALQAGFDHFVSKPPDFETFSDILQDCLGRQTGDQAMAAT